MRKEGISRKEFLAWLTAPALLAWLPAAWRRSARPVGEKETARGTEPELREADYYAPHSHGG